jgi:CNT family concentrative nucleoside transporter
MQNLISFIGIFVLMLVAWIFSTDRRNINWRVIFWAISFQFIFAAIIFWLPFGMQIFRYLNDVVLTMLSFAKEGIYYLFGPLALSPGEIGAKGEKSLGFILAIQALPTIVFFSGLMAFLYHIRLMPLIVRGFSFIFTKLMHISGAESLCASSNIFVGIESTFTIRPYIDSMTRSELCTILTAGMATIASSVLALYVSFLKNNFPFIAGHLISASILSAPAAIVMSKILYPENEKPPTLGKIVKNDYQRAASWIEAIIKGSMEGIKLIVGIVALLLTFLGFLAMLNWGLSKLGIYLDSLVRIQVDFSLQNLLGYIYRPFAFIIGVPLKDIIPVSKLLAERMIVTELVAYQHLDGLISSGILKDSRSITIVSYALCGFAHIASLAIFVGGISALAPKRTKDLAKLGFRALFAATLACLMTASIAGVFFINSQKILWLK